MVVRREVYRLSNGRNTAAKDRPRGMLQDRGELRAW